MSKKEEKPVPRSISLEIVPPLTDPILNELKLNESDCTKLIDALRKGRQEKIVKKLRLLTKRLTGVTNHLKNQELKAISLAKSIENVEKSLADKKLQIDGFKEFEQAAIKFRDQILGAGAKSSASSVLSARITTAAKMPQFSDAALKSKDVGTTLEMQIEYQPRMKLEMPEAIPQFQKELPIASAIPATLLTERAERRPYDPTDDPSSRTEAHLDSLEMNLTPHRSSSRSQRTEGSLERLNKKLFGTSKTDEVAERAPYVSADVDSRTEPNLDASTLATNVGQSHPSITPTKRVTLLKQEGDQLSPSTEETPEKKEREKMKEPAKVDTEANKSTDDVAVRADYQTADNASRTERELDNADIADEPTPEVLKKPESLVELTEKWAKIDQYVQKLKGKGVIVNQDEQLDLKAVRAEYTADDVKSRTERELSVGGDNVESTEIKADMESLEKDVLREVKTILRVEKKLDGRDRRKSSDGQLSQLAPASSDEDEKIKGKVVPPPKCGNGDIKLSKPKKQSPKRPTLTRRRSNAEDLIDPPSGGTTISIDEERPRRMPLSYIPSLSTKPTFETARRAANKAKITSSRSNSSHCDSFRTFWPTASFWRDRSCLSLFCLLIILLTTVYVAYRSLDALADAYKVPVDDCQQARYLCERFQKCCFTTCGSTKWQIFRRKVFGDGVKIGGMAKNELEFFDDTQIG